MKIVNYRNFSLATHRKNWGLERPNSCQFELTFRCGLHCKHCYTDCYNKPIHLKNELKTKQVKVILDKIFKEGIIWLCFTGGDPLARGDFIDIYKYAKKKGFIISIFTNAYSMNHELATLFKRYPPFVIEITLNAVTPELYDAISMVKGSFKNAVEGIELLLSNKLPLKIKTKVTKDNFRDLARIKWFVSQLGLVVEPSFDLNARLNGDSEPCNRRISSEDFLDYLELDKQNQQFYRHEFEQPSNSRNTNNRLFNCTIGNGDGIYIDPYGNCFVCNLIRKPVYNLLELDLGYILNKVIPIVKNKKFLTNSKCHNCKLRKACQWCPGKAYLETGDLEAHVPYFCDLAEKMDDSTASYERNRRRI